MQMHLLKNTLYCYQPLRWLLFFFSERKPLSISLKGSNKLRVNGLFTIYGNAHATRCTSYHAHSAIQSKRVQVGHFVFGNFFNLLPVYFAYFLAVAFFRTFLNFSCFH